MFILKYSSFDFDKQLHELAESVTIHHYGKKVVLKDTIGTGYFKVLQFPNRLKAVITNYVINQDFLGEREKVTADYYTIHINQVKTGSSFSVLINNQEIPFNNKVYASVFLTDSKESFGLKGSQGTCFSQLRIIIPKDWLQQHLKEIVDDQLLEEYFQLKEDRLFFDAFDPTYRALTDKVMHTEDNVFYLSVTQSIVTLITERFFTRMRNELQQRTTGFDLFDQVA